MAYQEVTGPYTCQDHHAWYVICQALQQGTKDVHSQACLKSKKVAIKTLMLPVVGCKLGTVHNLLSLPLPFVINLNGCSLNTEVVCYRGVISRTQQLVHTKDYVEFNVPYQVCCNIYVCSK